MEILRWPYIHRIFPLIRNIDRCCNRCLNMKANQPSRWSLFTTVVQSPSVMSVCDVQETTVAVLISSSARRLRCASSERGCVTVTRTARAARTSEAAVRTQLRIVVSSCCLRVCVRNARVHKCTCIYAFIRPMLYKLNIHALSSVNRYA